MKKSIVAYLVIVIQILLFTLTGCATDPWNLWGKGNSLGKDDAAVQEAYNTLCTAKEFTYAGTGDGGTMSKEVKAYSVVFKCRDARELFLKLENEATNEGKLFALCGIYYMDYDYFYKVIDNYASSDGEAEKVLGCIVIKDKLSNIVKREGEDVIRLLNNRETIEGWRKRNNKASFSVDFYGGGIPCHLKEYIEKYD